MRTDNDGTFNVITNKDVSHDLRTPLTMIKGYAEMIRDISREDEKQCAEDVAVIVDEADRLTALVNEILEYSELQIYCLFNVCIYIHKKSPLRGMDLRRESYYFSASSPMKRY